MGLVVVNPGLSTTVQDMGRPGHAACGVSAGGSFDRGSADLANALLGNAPGCALLEMTLVGGAYQAEGPLAMALAGAPIDARIVEADGSEHPLRVPSSFTLRDGARLVLGQMTSGARTYLAVKAGWDTPLILGSRSSEQPLPAGAQLPAASSAVPSRYLPDPQWNSPSAAPFRIVEGPDSRSSPALNAAFWPSRRFRIGPHHDRKGLRLEGEHIPVISDPERLSTPVGPGAVQAAGGELIVLGVACGTMGGYPHVAHVISADLDRLGQLKAGDEIRFECVTIDQARRALFESRKERHSLLRLVQLMSPDY